MDNQQIDIQNAALDAKIRALKLEKLRRLKNERYRFYIPNGKAEAFIKIIGENRHFINLFIAANGVGKTACLSNIMANICFEPHKPWFDYPLYNNWPYLKKGRIISDPTTVTKTIVPELHKWFPQDRYTTSKESKQYDSLWRTDTGFEFDIMTYEQDVKEFESATLGFALFDEPPPEDIFKATISRMRRGGIIIVGFTPLQGSAFFYDQYVTSKDTVTY